MLIRRHYGRASVCCGWMMCRRGRKMGSSLGAAGCRSSACRDTLPQSKGLHTRRQSLLQLWIGACDLDWEIGELHGGSIRGCQQLSESLPFQPNGKGAFDGFVLPVIRSNYPSLRGTKRGFSRTRCTLGGLAPGIICFFFVILTMGPFQGRSRFNYLFSFRIRHFFQVCRI